MEVNTSILDEIKAKLDRIEENQKKTKKRNSIILYSFLAFLLILAIIITLTLIPLARDYDYLMKEVKKAGDIIDTIDIDEVKRISNSVSNIDFEKLSESINKLEEIDMDGLVKAVNQVQSTINSISSIFN